MRFLIQSGLFLICLLILPGRSDAQISGNGQSYQDSTIYPFFKTIDPIFIYTFSCTGVASATPSLNAVAPNNLDSCDYTWTSFNLQTRKFDIPVKSEIQVSSGSLSAAGQGGYQVRITKGNVLDTTFRCWIFIHHLSVSVLKSAEGKVLSSKYTCQYVEVNGTLKTDTFYYYDPSSGDSVILNNNTSIYWSFINKEGLKDKAFFSLNTRTYTPPVYDTRFYLVASDKFGASCADTVLYISIQTRAKFTYKYYDHYGDSTGFITMSSKGVSAPAKFQFINHSINGATYQWILTDTVFRGDTAHRLVNATDTLFKPEYTYYIPRWPDAYIPKLISRSAQHCVDTFVADTPILIMASELGIKQGDLRIPNVFTPNGDKVNDDFVVYPYDDDIDKSEHPNPPARFASIKTFHIIIYDRWGLKVHEFYGDINDWVGSGRTGTHGGWDGRVMNSNREAPSGIYYYVIEAMGWDDARYEGKGSHYMGAVYLYREKTASNY